MKKALTIILALCMVLTLVPTMAFAAENEQAAPVFEPSDWTAPDGYGSIETVSDNVVILKGDDELNSDNSHCGPYTKAKASQLADGTIVDEVNVFINPAKMAAGEKFSLTTSINGGEGETSEYLSETVVNFWKDNEGGVSVAVGLAPEFSAQIKTAGIYTLQYKYAVKDDAVVGTFTILKRGETIATTGEFAMSPAVAAADAKERGYVWFCDISVADGLKVYSELEFPFTDVTADQWFYNAVVWAYETEVSNGMSATLFGPDEDITRGQFVTMLYRYYYGGEVPTTTSGFTDVPADAYYSDAVAWAVEEGITNGFEDNTFRPNDPISREQMVAMMYRYADGTAPESDNLADYTDAANVGDYAKDAMNWAVGNGIIKGVTEDTLVPQGTATRAQIVTVLMRHCDTL